MPGGSDDIPHLKQQPNTVTPEFVVFSAPPSKRQPLMRAWVDRATTRELASVQAARHGERVLLRGDRLPAIANAERFWGDGVLRPLGFRVEPDLPETAIRAAAAVSLNELLVLAADGAEAIPYEAFTPLTRAAARLAAM